MQSPRRRKDTEQPQKICTGRCATLKNPSDSLLRNDELLPILGRLDDNQGLASGAAIHAQ